MRYVSKSIPRQVTVLARQYLCLADLAVDGFANSLEAICGQKSLQTPRCRGGIRVEF